MTPSPALSTRWRDLPSLAKGNVIALFILGVALCATLWPEWVHDPDLSHGFFMPVIFVYALVESRAGPARYLGAGAWRITAAAAATGVGVIAVAGLYAAALGWSNALVTFLLAAGFCSLALSLLSSVSTRTTALIPFNWSSVVACSLWILCAPIPPGSYTRLSLTLQLAISRGVLKTLHFLGIAAHQNGNVIELANASVGIEDACSGVRSLLSCVFAALFFSAVLVRRPPGRTFLILLSAPLALGMNFLRSLFLTVLVSRGIRIEGTWHDTTGYAVLLLTAAILGGFAFVLSQAREPRYDPSAPGAKPGPAAARWAAVGLALSVLMVAFFYHNTRPAIRHDTPPPDLDALLPSSAPGWKVVTRNDLYEFQGTLRTDHLAERTYIRNSPEGLQQITLYVAYWEPGQAPVSLVSMHTPDACWPGTGWVALPTANSQQSPPVAGVPLPLAEYRLFVNQDFPQHVWFWHLYDGRPIAFQNPYSARALLTLAWNYGFRHDGDQLFVRVSSNRPWASFQDNGFILTFFHRVHSLGL